MHKILVAFVTLAACATEPAPSPTAEPTSTRWTFYTRVGCGNSEHVDTRKLCVSPSARDAYTPGDAAATDAANALQTGCAPIATVDGWDIAGVDCPNVTVGGIVTRQNWSCIIADEPDFEPCVN